MPQNKFLGYQLGRLGVVKERLPLFPHSTRIVSEKHHIGRLVGLFGQLQPGSFGRTVTFDGIATLAGSYQISPTGFSTLGARHHMVKGQILIIPTVLTAETVPFKNILTGKYNTPVGQTDILEQTNHRGHGKRLAYRMQHITFYLSQKFSFIQKYKDKGPLQRADCQWTIILI
jgi:hypothetical protein